jgi:hypothetical protein
MLINNNTELKNHLPTSVALDFGDIKPKIRLVEREIIKRIFSQALYDIVADGSLSGQKLELQELLTEATAHLALLHYIGFGQTQINSAGIQIASNDNMKTAFEWQIAELRKECSTQGWAAIESALEFLESVTDTDIKTAWEASHTFLNAKETLIDNIRQFEKFVNLNHSRILFNKLLPVLNDQQEEVIIPAIGQELFDKILAFQDEIEEPRKKALTATHKLASKALAFKTMAVGFMDTLLILSDNGPLVIDGLRSNPNEAKKTAPTDLVKIIAENYKIRASGAKRELIEFCQANVAFLPEYKLSDNYISDSDQQNHIPRNDPGWGIAFF